MDSVTERVCGREEDLISFLYGELNEAAAQSFRNHMKDCVSCASELNAFGDIRQSVITWRNESLGTLSSPGPAPMVPRRSASAALREFFNLSPVWMKAVVGFASILFCILAVLAVSSLRQSPSPEEINVLVERRVQEELNRLSSQAQVATTTQEDVRPVNVLSKPSHRSKRMKPLRNDARRPLTRVEREQLAADLRLIEGTNDNELELLGDAINQ